MLQQYLHPILNLAPSMSIGLDEFESAKGQKFIYLNIRSLMANFSQFQVDFMYSRAMVIGLTETWLNSNTISSLVDLKGFAICRHDRRVKKRGGGVLLYINDKYNWDLLDDKLNCSYENIELLNIVINRPNQSKLCVSVCFVPPTANFAMLYVVWTKYRAWSAFRIWNGYWGGL